MKQTKANLTAAAVRKLYKIDERNNRICKGKECEPLKAEIRLLEQEYNDIMQQIRELEENVA